MKMSKSIKAVLEFIKTHAKDNKLISSNARIAVGANVTDRTVQNATNWLRDHGYIEKINHKADDYRSGKKINLCNEYIILDKTNEKNSNEGLRKISYIKNLKDLKESFKEKDLKQEEDRMREESISVSIQEEKQQQPTEQATEQDTEQANIQPTPQVELLEQSDLSDVQKKTVKNFIIDYPVEVVRYCLEKFSELNAKGMIVSIVGWIRSVLTNELKRFLKFGFCGFPQRKQKSQTQKSLRHRVNDSLEKLHKNRMNLRYRLQQAIDENRTTDMHELQVQIDAAEALFKQANEKTAKRVESSFDLTCSDDGVEVTSDALEAVRNKIKAYEKSLHAEAVSSVG